MRHLAPATAATAAAAAAAGGVSNAFYSFDVVAASFARGRRVAR